MENKTNQKEEHISQIESKIGESPFSNYYSNSLGGENAKIKKSNDLEPLPNKDRLEIKNTGKNKRKDNQTKMGSFDFKSEFNKMKRDMLTSLRDNLNLNIPETKENIENQYNSNTNRVSKNVNNTKPVTINKEYNDITKPVTINKEYNDITNPVTINKEYNTTKSPIVNNKNVNKSYPLNTVIKDTTNTQNVSNKMNNIKNSVENNIVKSINDNKNYKQDTVKNYKQDTVKNYIIKNISTINDLKPKSTVHNALNIKHPPMKSVIPFSVQKENIPNIIHNKNTHNNNKVVKHEMYSNPQHYVTAMPNIIKEEKETPVLPGLAKGGLMNKPTQTVIAEAGPELAIPLEKTPEIIGQAIEKSRDVSARNASSSINQNQTQKLNSKQGDGGDGGGGSPALLTNSNENVINAPSMSVSGSGISKFDRSTIRNIALPSWRTNLG